MAVNREWLRNMATLETITRSSGIPPRIDITVRWRDYVGTASSQSLTEKGLVVATEDAFDALAKQMQDEFEALMVSQIGGMS